MFSSRRRIPNTQMSDSHIFVLYPHCLYSDEEMRSDELATSITLIFVFVYTVKEFVLKLIEQSFYS